MGKARKTAVLKAFARQWTPFGKVEITPEMRGDHPQLEHCFALYSNSRFEVQFFQINTSIGGVMQMVACRHGGLEDATWEELQRIKVELFGPEAVAVEVYPGLASEWHITKPVRVLWILPSVWEIPFGLHLPGAWGKPS